MSAELLFRNDAYLQKTTAAVTASGPDGVRLDRTLFYPLGGGQPGDTGMLSWAGGSAAITDTRKYKSETGPEDVQHLLPPDAAFPAVGTAVELDLDWPRRYAYMRMHTCLHLLCAALPGVAVTGGQVGAEKSRLDFDASSAQVGKDALAQALNRLITENHLVTERWITDEEMADRPDLVRTMSVKPPMGFGKVRLLAIGDGIDLQPCGGTHVRRTGEIGPVEVTKIENKGKQNRRVVVTLLQQDSPV